MIYERQVAFKSGRLRTPWLNWQFIRACPVPYTLCFVAWLLILSVPVGLGLVEKAVFDDVTGVTPAGLNLETLLALYVALGLVRFGCSLIDGWGSWTFRRAVGKLLRYNLFASLLRRPGALPLPVAPGEAINRFQSDVDEVSDFPTWAPDVVGQVLAFAVAVGIMARINFPIALIVFLPLVVALLVSRIAWGKFHAFIEAERVSSDAVTGFLGEIFAAVQAVKLAGAEAPVIERYRGLNRARRRATVNVRLLWESIGVISGVSSTFGIGVTLLLAGQLMARGSFTVGDFALFVSYLWFTTELPTFLGTFVGDYRQQDVAISRLSELIPGEPLAVLVAPLKRADKQIGAAKGHTAIDLSSHRFEHLVARGVTYEHPGSGRGVRGVDLCLARGSFTVITGRIGSGKTTFLRALLGLLPMSDGEIYWNGQRVVDRSATFVPPRCACVPQVPCLVSASVRDNILLGRLVPPEVLAAAIRTAVLEPDIATMEKGLETIVGPRGVRLSGGQIQRVAAARSLVGQPELLVCDDLSSALDVETEQMLWQRIREHANSTDLIVSHRRPVLAQADWIMVLRDGQVEAQGKLADLLERSDEFRRIWETELPR